MEFRDFIADGVSFALILFVVFASLLPDPTTIKLIGSILVGFLISSLKQVIKSK